MKSIYESIKDIMLEYQMSNRYGVTKPGPNQTNIKSGGGVDIKKQAEVKANVQTNRPDFRPFINKQEAPQPGTGMAGGNAIQPNRKAAPQRPAKEVKVKDAGPAGDTSSSPSTYYTPPKTERPEAKAEAKPKYDASVAFKQPETNTTPFGGKKDEPSAAATPFAPPTPEKDVDRSPKAITPSSNSDAETTAKKITNMGRSSDVDDEATAARNSVAAQVKSGAFNPARGQNVERSAEAEKYVNKSSYTKPDIPQAASKEPDTTLRSGSGEAVKSGSGGTWRTDTDDVIARRGLYGTIRPAKKTNEQFGVSDKLYRSVMEVLQKGSKPRNEKEQKLAAMHGDPDVITHGDILKARGVKMKEDVGIKENTDTPGNSYEHQCAIHVKSESFGEGRTVTTQHADPDEYGNIAWYDVMFEHGIERYVPTNELEILVSESHMHSMKKKKKKM